MFKAKKVNCIGTQVNPQYASYPTGMSHEILLLGHINGTSSFAEDILKMRTATENDTFHITIDSYGGNMDTAIALCNEMKKSRARFVAEVISSCCSAATVIFLSADEYLINEDIEFMIHDYSTALGGKSGEIHANETFTRARLHKFMEKIYEGFLTKEELEDVFKGQDLYFTENPLLERLKGYAEHKNKVAMENTNTYISIQQDTLEGIINSVNNRNEIIPAIRNMFEESQHA